ncbi:hypothetical protein HPP92_000571 [Vanilla planifolia]|uniref:Sugar phosphate transporter domain-containing protein n=1 Tax=Vanilla planifolia TaxID=51239 RepID=A0A835VG81_VANPL|nr:hypothetical protein HPP92_000571 [Vanilla planifolia]
MAEVRLVVDYSTRDLDDRIVDPGRAVCAAKATEAGNEEDRMESTTTIQRDPSFSRWYVEDQIEPLIGSIGREEDSGVSEAEEFELPLLHGDESRNGDCEPEVRPNFFRQRSWRSGENNGRKFGPFNVENGLHASDSRAKLDLLEQSAQSFISPVIVFKTLFYIIVWYTFSTCLTLYNKTLLGEKLGKFPAPLLMSTFHFVLQAVLSRIILCFHKGGSDSNATMTWKDYFLRVVPMALGTALDINLSNASLVFISVTFATMCKSASPIFLLLFAFAFRLENPSIKLFGIISIISVGVLLTVAKETEFEFWGFLFVMLAAVMSGFRWSMTQILLQKETYGLKDPITLMSHVTPIMAVSTALFSLGMDPWHEFHKNPYFNSSWHIVRSCLLMLIGGSLAFLMVLTEYILISATSAVTVTIAGVVKEAITILVAVFYFHDPFTLLKGLGLLTIMIGASLFNLYKYQKLKKGQLLEDRCSTVSNEVETRFSIIDEINCDDGET